MQNSRDARLSSAYMIQLGRILTMNRRHLAPTEDVMHLHHVVCCFALGSEGSSKQASQLQTQDKLATHLVIPEPTLLFILHLQRAITVVPTTAIPQLFLQFIFIVDSDLLADLLLFITINEAILSRHGLYFPITKEWHVQACFDIRDFLDVSLSENKVDFLKRTLPCLGIEEVDDWNEAGIYNCKEEVCSPADVRNHNWSDHYYQEIK
jgi:hypothetical protein